MNKDEQGNHFIGHVETKEKEENRRRKCVTVERKPKRGGYVRKYRNLDRDKKEINNRTLCNAREIPFEILIYLLREPL